MAAALADYKPVAFAEKIITSIDDKMRAMVSKYDRRSTILSKIHSIFVIVCGRMRKSIPISL